MKKFLLIIAFTLVLTITLALGFEVTTFAGEYAHANHEGADWTELTLTYVTGLTKSGTNNGYILPSGKYYISDDLTFETSNQRLYIEDNSTVEVCLNGHTLKECFIVSDSANLTLCSCQDEGEVGHTVIPVVRDEGSGDLTIKDVNIEGCSWQSTLSKNGGGTLTIDGCTIQNNTGFPFGITDVQTAKITNTSIVNNKYGIQLTNSKLEFQNVIMNGNTEYDVDLYNSTLTLDGENTSIGEVVFEDDSRIVLGDDYGSNKIGVTLDSNQVAPYTISDEYSNLYKCKQLPYHIANRNGKSVLEYRIQEQPSKNNLYEFVLDKNGDSTSEDLVDSEITYRWSKVNKTLLSKCNYAVVNYDDIDTNSELQTFANSAVSGKLYVVGDVSGNSVSSNSMLDGTSYPHIMLICKDDDKAPDEVSFTSTSNDSYMKLLGGFCTFSDYDHNLKVCWFYDTTDGTNSLNLSNVTLLDYTLIENETAAKLSNAEDGSSYRCTATLKDDSKISSDIVSLDSADKGKIDTDNENGTIKVDTGDTSRIMLYFVFFNLLMITIATMLYARVRNHKK